MVRYCAAAVVIEWNLSDAVFSGGIVLEGQIYRSVPIVNNASCRGANRSSTIHRRTVVRSVQMRWIVAIAMFVGSAQLAMAEAGGVVGVTAAFTSIFDSCRKKSRRPCCRRCTSRSILSSGRKYRRTCWSSSALCRSLSIPISKDRGDTRRDWTVNRS